MQGLVQGKVALITGAGSGVGRAAVLLFCEHGAKVVAADINGANAEETAALAVAAGGEAMAVTCNVADPASVDAAVAHAAGNASQRASQLARTPSSASSCAIFFFCNSAH